MGLGGIIGGAGQAERARGWIRVLQTDVWATVAIPTCATVPFCILGAGILHPLGARPEGLDSVRALSGMFTATLGACSLWVFGVGAFFILFSTMLSAVGAGARFIPDYAVGVPQPILLVTIGAVTQALLLPVQSGATLWLQRHHLDPRVRPSRFGRLVLGATFGFQLAMATLLIRFTIL
jgi:hypothetical protein